MYGPKEYLKLDGAFVKQEYTNILQNMSIPFEQL